MLKFISLFLMTLFASPKAEAAQTLLLADAGVAWANQQQLNEWGVRTGYHITLGPLFVGPEAGFHRFTGPSGSTDLVHAGLRGGLDVLTALSFFARYEGLGSETTGMSYGMSFDFNKVPGLTAGIHGAMTDLDGAWMANAGLHGGLRF
jgi:hypothetical protein